MKEFHKNTKFLFLLGLGLFSLSSITFAQSYIYGDTLPQQKTDQSVQDTKARPSPSSVLPGIGAVHDYKNNQTNGQQNNQTNSYVDSGYQSGQIDRNISNDIYYNNTINDIPSHKNIYEIRREARMRRNLINRRQDNTYPSNPSTGVKNKIIGSIDDPVDAFNKYCYSTKASLNAMVGSAYRDGLPHQSGQGGDRFLVYSNKKTNQEIYLDGSNGSCTITFRGYSFHNAVRDLVRSDDLIPFKKNPLDTHGAFFFIQNVSSPLSLIKLAFQHGLIKARPPRSGQSDGMGMSSIQFLSPDLVKKFL